MEYKPIKPKFIGNVKEITKSNIKSSTGQSAKAWFNWLEVDFPYMHNHTNYEIFILVRGKVKHTINDIVETCSRGYACLIRPEDRHKIESLDKEKEFQMINFIFSKKVAGEIFKLYKGFPLELSGKNPLSFYLKGATLEAIVNNILIAQSKSKNKYTQYAVLIISQLIAELLLNKIGNESVYPLWLTNFLEYINDAQNFSMSVYELASSTSYSYSRVSKLFKKYMGQSILEYVTNIKIMYAKNLLKNSDKSIMEISLDVGYSNVSTFNHNFKSITSISPSKYRKSSY